MFKRIKNLLAGFFSLFIRGLEVQNPEALLEAEKERVRKMISNYNQALAPQAGLVERLKRQIALEEKNERELHAKVKANVSAGNTALAGQYALQYQQMKRDMAENKAQLVTAEETYRNLIKTRDVSMTEAQQKIAAIASGISRMKLNQANAELTEMASSMIGQIGGGGDNLNRLENIVNEEADKAAGRARVAKDSMNTADVEMKEAEQLALASQALADFAAESGISLDNVSPVAAEPMQKVMG